MENNKKYNIEDFYIGELYLYTNFANFTSRNYREENQSKLKQFSQTKAINFQQDLLSHYIDWDNGREYTGFLTIFYKQGNRYLNLHDGNVYSLSRDTYIENLIPITDLLPKINYFKESLISIPRAIELFDILFQKNNEECLYQEIKQPLSNYYIANITLKELYHQESNPDSRYIYFNLPLHLMLEKLDTCIYSYEELDYINKVYRCIFLKQDINFYNLNNHQFYNQNDLDNIITLSDYLDTIKLTPPSTNLTISKCLKLYKHTI